MRTWLRRLSAFALVAVLVLAPAGMGILYFARLGYQNELRQRSALLSPRAVEFLEPIEIGGVQQWIFARGEDPRVPLLLWLHGGPGSPAMPNARFIDDRLVQHLVVVHWDQRGSGKSFGLEVPADSYTVEQLVADAEELVEELLERFDRDRLYLLGHSWGTALGSYLVVRRPELFHAWISMGTDARTAEAETIGYRWVRARASDEGHAKALEELEEIGPPPYDGLLELATERGWLEHFGGATRHPERHGSYLQRIFRSPEYSLLDVGRAIAGNLVSAHRMVFDVMESVDLFQQAPRIEVPAYFLQGRYDYNTPAELAKRYFDELEAPRGKTWIWFEDSAHSPHLDETEAFQRVLIERVLAETREQSRSGDPDRPD